MKHPTHVYELVNVTDEERYYPLGVFTELDWAIREAEQYDPSKWDGDAVEDFACAEIRMRAVGLSSQDYLVLWRCEWLPETNEWDAAWVHDEPQIGTIEQPLTLCRS